VIGILVATLTLWGSMAMAADPTIIAHRGASGLAPENTLPAFERAIEAKSDGIEFDVHLTADGEVVVHHDFQLSPEWTRKDGTWLNGPGPALRDLTLAEVRAYDVGRLSPGSKYAKRYPAYTPVDGTPVPTLAEVLELVRAKAPADFELWVELKLAPSGEAPTSDPVALSDKTIAQLAAASMLNRTTLISFYWPALLHAQRTHPGIRTGYLSAERSWTNNIQAGRPDSSPWTAPFDIDDFGHSVPGMIKAAGGNAWSVYWRDLTPERLVEARRLGLQVGIWTIRSEDEVVDALATGADVITTDRPDWFKP
jgi:glycerophosphoryl diester phosphodiesterase